MLASIIELLYLCFILKSPMKSLQLVLSLVIVSIIGCTKPGDHSSMNHSDDQSQEEGPNQALYDQMMNVHDQVMPEMDEIMRLKRELQEKIKNSPDLVLERKQQLEKAISNLDSASTVMMNWMHRIAEYNPMADTIDQEKAREFLESETEEIRKVKDFIAESIEKAKEISKQ